MAAILTSCSSEMEEFHYEGSEFVQFSDSLFDMPVTKDEPVFEVPVVITTAASVDRYVIVDVDQKNSNATEGWHFDIENRNVLVPAGKRTANVRIRGHYDHLSAKDSLAVTLRIVTEKEKESEIYGVKTNVRLYKIMPFNIDDYAGDMLLTCTFPFSTSTTTTYLVKSERQDDSTLVVKGPFSDSRDFVLNFHTGKDDPFDREIDMKEQIAFTDVNFGPLAMATVPGYPSYYIPEDRAFVLLLNAYLPGFGTFGNYYYIFQWITPDEAEARRNGLSTLY